MDFYKNIDKLCGCRVNHYGDSVELSGVSYSVVTDLATEPVVLADFKQHARIDFNTDDNLVSKYITGARQYLEMFSQLSFGNKTIRFTALNIPSRYRLVNGPYSTILTPGTGFTLFGDSWLIGGGSMVDITLETDWPNLPEAIKVAIMKRAAGDYSLRENVIVTEDGNPVSYHQLYDDAERLLNPYRNISIFA